MVPSLTTIRQRLTGEWAMLRQPDAILAACGELGDTGWRGCPLTPVTAVQAFPLQILHGHTACTPPTLKLHAIRFLLKYCGFRALSIRRSGIRGRIRATTDDLRT